MRHNPTGGWKGIASPPRFRAETACLAMQTKCRPGESGVKVRAERRGGFRPGAGRTLSVGRTCDPLVFLLAVMNCDEATARLRVMAAKAALPYVHAPGA